jgi:mono/diheme cytochrome c family protein
VSDTAVLRVTLVLGASAVLLLAGCAGGDESEGTTETAAAPATTTAVPVPTGRELFTQTCSGCHTLKDAGTTGTVGPNLDKSKPTKARVLFMLNNGGGGGLGVMPKFRGTLSDTQIQALATYVSSVAGKS